MITLQELLNSKTDLFKKSRVKLVRHKDSREEYRELLKQRETLIEYQKQQSKEVFKDCDYIISFLGIERRRSVLFGIFKVNGVGTKNGKFYYDLTQINEFDYLNDRIVIDWGANAIAWHQWYDSQVKEIVQILPEGYLGTFPGLLQFVLDFDELKKLTINPEANFDWKNHLSSVNGVYLILDTRTGNQYIGSAYGNDGIWQRWSEYARNITGGNRKLEELYNQDENCFKYFRYSILQTLPSNITAKEIIKIENLYKEKLGTRAFGLNLN